MLRKTVGAMMVALGMGAAGAASAQALDLLVGSYTQGNEPGLFVYAFDAASGKIAAKPRQALQVHNPSWLVVTPDQRNVYAINENGPGNPDPIGRVTRFARTAQGLQQQERVDTLSDHPTHASLSRDGRFLFVANYAGDAQPGGLLTVLPLDAQGALGPAVQVQSYQGSRANPARQMSGHVHAAVVSPDGSRVLVADLGGDRVYLYRYVADAERPLQAQAPAFVQFAPGSGPRHVAISADGKHAYVTLEMTGEVAELALTADGAHVRTLHAMTPKDFDGQHGAGAIHLSADGRFLYAINRVDDNHIVVYSVDAETGALTQLQRRSTEAASTREFTFSPDGRFLLLAVQGGDRIAVLQRDPASGLLGKTVHSLPLSRPSYLQLLPAR